MSQTYDYVSERRLLYFTQKLKQHFPTASSFIDDSVAAIDKLWSSQKVSDELAGKVDVETGKGLSTNDFDDTYKQKLDDLDTLIGDLIDDTTDSALDKTWSAKKIHDEIAAVAGLEFVKVDALPATGQSNRIYLLPIRIITAVTTIAGTDATVDKGTFVSQLPNNGTYIFTYDGTDWTYDSNVVDLTDYGISYDTSITPATNDTITVVLASGSNPNVFEEYIWFTDTSVTPEVSYYELIGTTEANLDGYVKDEDMIEITTAEIDNIINTVFGSV